MPSSVDSPPIHQFCRIGTHAFISGLTGVSQDIPPYMLASGSRAKLFGLNTVGLKRHHFSEETVESPEEGLSHYFSLRSDLGESDEDS